MQLQSWGLELGNGSSATKVHGLRRAIAGTSYAWLVDMIDWEDTPQRSTAVLTFWVISAVLAFPLVVAGVSGAVMIARSVWPAPAPDPYGYSYPDYFAPQTPVLGVDSVLQYAGYWPVLLVAIAGAYLTSWCVAAARRELSKFPELALFGAKAPTLYLRRFRGENPQLPVGEGPALLVPWLKVTFLFVILAFLYLLLFGGVALGVTIAVLWLLGAWATISGFLVSIAILRFMRRVAAGARDYSFENLLSKTAARRGPVICLSDPLNRTKGGEALRLRIRNEHWQDVVTGLADVSNIVVMSYSEGANLDWEAALVLANQKHPVLIYLPNLPNDWKDDLGKDAVGWVRNSVPAWLREQIEAAPELKGNSRVSPTLVLRVKPGRDVRAVRTEATWTSVRERLSAFMEDEGFKPVKNVHASGKGLGALRGLRFLLGGGPRLAAIGTAVVILPHMIAIWGMAAAIVALIYVAFVLL